MRGRRGDREFSVWHPGRFRHAAADEHQHAPAPNTRLRRSLGTPFRASGVNFFVGLCFLIVLSFILGDGLIPFRKLAGQPVWMFLGGFCGVTVLTGNLLLFPILGATQTIVFPLFGQIVMGILIDTFGWFRGDVVPLTLWLGGSSEEKADETRTQSQLWAARLFGVSFGTLGAVQTAINGQLGAFLDSPVQSSMMNFLVGTMALGLLCSGRWPSDSSVSSATARRGSRARKDPGGCGSAASSAEASSCSMSTCSISSAPASRSS